MLSNSRTQKLHIDGVAKEKGFKNVTVITGDVNVYDFEEKEQSVSLFPRPPHTHLTSVSRPSLTVWNPRFTHIMSIEMFEHMKAYPTLFKKVSTWLKPQGLVFIHIFCHRTTPYHFEENDGWMAQTFFSGGTMPSLDLFTYFQKDLTLLHSSYLNGTHYSRTLEDWLKNQDKNRKSGLKILEDGQGKEEGIKTFNRFRVFFMACSEFFALDGGETWGVGKYLFEKR